MDNYCEVKPDDVFIKINDFDTRDLNIKVLELGEKKPSALKYEKSEAYGQDGFTKVSENAYKGFSRTSIIMVNNHQDYNILMNNLYIGMDVKVEYSDDDFKFRYGTISDIVDTVIIGENRQIMITIDLQPFKYGKDLKIEVNNDIIIYSKGNIYSKPIIEVLTGVNGTGIITINNKSMEVKTINNLFIDSNNYEIYDSEGLLRNSNRLNGSFFKLKPNENNISYSGDIDNLNIYVNWRWL